MFMNYLKDVVEEVTVDELGRKVVKKTRVLKDKDGIKQREIIIYSTIKKTKMSFVFVLSL